MAKRIVQMSVLPGEPLDGTGRICIHLFVRDPHGPFVEPHVLHPALDENGEVIKQKFIKKPTRGRLACHSKMSVAPVTRKGVTIVTSRTEEPSAVTCPKCKESIEYVTAMIPTAVEETAE